jgi:type 1 glutamine amidotransferase
LAPGFVNYKKGALDSTRNDKIYQLLACGRWFSPDTPASTTTKAGRHDIAEILLKVALNTINSIQIKSYTFDCTDQMLQNGTWLCHCGTANGIF